MKTEQEILLKLLRRSCWKGNASPTVLQSAGQPDWTHLLAMAEEQEVLGLIYDALPSVAGEERPEVPLLMSLSAKILRMEQGNQLYRQQLYPVLRRIYGQGIKAVLFKGIALARLYANPLHRPVGDVDLMVSFDQMNRTLDSMKEFGLKLDDQYDPKHWTAQCSGLNWELHFHSMALFSRRLDRRYRILEAEETMPDMLLHETIDGERVSLFSPLFGIIHLTAHIQHHLLVERLTLRQIIDWMLYLHHERTALAIAEGTLERMLRRLGLYRLYRALGAVAVACLGAYPDSYAGISHLSKRELRRGRYLLSIVMLGHVPHCAPTQQHVPGESRWSKLRQYLQLCKRSLLLSRLFPREALSTPLGYLRQSWRRNGSVDGKKI